MDNALKVQVLCFNCGAMYDAPAGTKDITSKCEECKD